jgi:hypothetical protein
MQMRITRYGKSKEAGGWDNYQDDGTDKLEGDHGNTLVDKVSCALTASARAALNISHGQWVFIQFSDGLFQCRRYDDTAPEENERVDLFYEFHDEELSELADVTVIPN